MSPKLNILFLKLTFKLTNIKQRNLLYANPKKYPKRPKLQATRYLDPEKPENNLPFAIITYKDKLAIIDYENNDPKSILIDNEMLSKAFKNLFEKIWNNTE